MKKWAFFLFTVVPGTILFSFTTHRGGDVLQIFLNDRQVLQQFVHNDKSVHTLQLSSGIENDRVEVFYSHCGQAGKSRMLLFKNEKNEVVKKLQFPDAATARSAMLFYRKDMAKSSHGAVKLYYSSKELPVAKWIATLTWKESSGTAKTASL